MMVDSRWETDGQFRSGKIKRNALSEIELSCLVYFDVTCRFKMSNTGHIAQRARQFTMPCLSHRTALMDSTINIQFTVSVTVQYNQRMKRNSPTSLCCKPTVDLVMATQPAIIVRILFEIVNRHTEMTYGWIANISNCAFEVKTFCGLFTIHHIHICGSNTTSNSLSFDLKCMEQMKSK